MTHHPRLAALLAEGPPSEARIVEFLQTERTPLVEPGAVTFIWAGHAAEVDLLRWIRAGVDRTSFEKVDGAPLWVLRLPVQDEGRFEYKLAIDWFGREEWILDPHNPLRAGDPFGENSVCRTFGYALPSWSQPQGAPEGRVGTFSLKSEAFGQMRREQIYLPARYDPAKAYPLLIVHDGRDFAEYANLRVSLDNLIHAGDIPPLIALWIQTDQRMDEYPYGRRHGRYLARELLPLAAARYRISPRPQDRVLLGASLGAVASLATAFRHPGVFGGLVLNSGSFVFDQRKLEARPHPVFQRVAHLLRALNRIRDLPPTRAFVSTGELEGLADENRTLAIFLRERGVDVMFKSAWDGHHWHNWRDQLRDGLMWVLNPEGLTATTP